MPTFNQLVRKGRQTVSKMNAHSSNSLTQMEKARLTYV